MTRRHAALGVLLLLVIALSVFFVYGRSVWVPVVSRFRGERTVADVIQKYGPEARARLGPHFARAGVAWPPKRIALLVFKEERRVALWAVGRDGQWRFIRAYPVRAASGHAGPKLREGDLQVPEGIYRIEGLNPNSSYHLSIRVGYPNEFDRRMAARDRRSRLGGDIFIHGKSVSIGCVAVGDAAIEELFTLAAATGTGNIKVIIAPNDLRVAEAVRPDESLPWVGDLYRGVAAALTQFPVWQEADSAIDVRGMRKIPKR